MRSSAIEGLESLSLYATRVTNTGATYLDRFKNLRKLNLSKTLIGDSAVEEITKLKELESLHLDYTMISGESLKAISAMGNLKELHIRGTVIQDKDLEHLSNLNNLQVLDVGHTKITEDTLKTLKTLGSLKTLNFTGTSISLYATIQFAQDHENFDVPQALLASGKASANVNDELIGINLTGEENLSNDDLEILKDHDLIVGVSLRETDVSDGGLIHLSHLDKLKSLDLGATAITDLGLQHLMQCKEFTGFRVDKTKVTFGGVHSFLETTQNCSVVDTLRIIDRQLGRNGYPSLGPSQFPSKDPAILKLDQLHKQSSPKGLISADLRELNIRDEDIQFINQLDKVGALFLNGNDLSDSGISKLHAHQDLELLWVSGRWITRDGLVSLTPLSKLHTLWLTDTSLSDADLIVLRAFPKLRILNLCGTNLTDAGIAHLLKCRSLTMLIIDHTALTDSGIETLRKARPSLIVFPSQKKTLQKLGCPPKTKFYDIQLVGTGNKRGPVSTRIPNISMQHIFGSAYFEQAEYLRVDENVRPSDWATLSTLTGISFGIKEVTNEELLALNHLPNLKRISFYRSQLPVNGLSLYDEASVEDVNLERTNIIDADLANIVGWEHLKALSLGGYGTNITDKGIAHLSTMTQLEKVSLNRTKITDAALGFLASLPNLSSISLRETNVTDKGIASLSKLKRLEDLDLYYTKFTDNGLDSLTNLKTLKSISLGGSHVTNEGVNRLRKALPNCRIRYQPPRR